jgi:hypothetical protein
VKRTIRSLTLSVLLAGCYSLQPVTAPAPQPGMEIAFDLNDVGRVALGGSMGPAITQIGGRLINKDNGEYIVAVSEVQLLGGGAQVWKGEQVHIKPEYVGSLYERRFSKGRTVALSAVTIGALTAFIASRSLIGSGEERSKPPGDSAQATIIRP